MYDCQNLAVMLCYASVVIDIAICWHNGLHVITFVLLDRSFWNFPVYYCIRHIIVSAQYYILDLLLMCTCSTFPCWHHTVLGIALYYQLKRNGSYILKIIISYPIFCMLSSQSVNCMTWKFVFIMRIASN